jgi:hypothetical protein
VIANVIGFIVVVSVVTTSAIALYSLAPRPRRVAQWLRGWSR